MIRLDRRRLKTVAMTLAVLAVAGAIGAVATVGLGLYNVSARKGHWPGVSWVLNTTFRNSARLRDPGPAAVPVDLADPQRVALGARHFQTGCTLCHGTPGSNDRSATTRAMVPEPPTIAEAVDSWAPEEMFWVVSEGIKMSGMPHWPSLRDDDVWPVVSFLREAETMSAAEYRALVAPAPGADARASGSDPGAYCASCHGVDGNSRNSYIPRLDTLSLPYIQTALEAYADGRRQSGVMQQAASLFDGPTLQQLAERMAALPTVDAPIDTDPDPALVEKGAALASARGPKDDVAACTACHGPWPSERSPLFPPLAGQGVSYLATQLNLWRDEKRGGGPKADLMRKAAEWLEDDDVEALAAYYASLPPSEGTPEGAPQDEGASGVAR